MSPKCAQHQISSTSFFQRDHLHEVFVPTLLNVHIYDQLYIHSRKFKDDIETVMSIGCCNVLVVFHHSYNSACRRNSRNMFRTIITRTGKITLNVKNKEFRFNVILNSIILLLRTSMV
jgi:hypothetical protein